MAGFTDKFSVRVKKEIKKIKELPTFSKKMEYLWGYYKVPFLLTIFFIGCIISIVYEIRSNNYDRVLNITMVNLTTDDFTHDTGIMEGLANEWLGIDGKDQRVSVAGYLEVDLEYVTEEVYASQMKLAASIAASQEDLFFGDEKFMDAYRQGGIFKHLDEFLPQELYDELLSQGRILFYENDEGVSCACGIDMSGLNFTDTLIFSTPKPILSVVTNAKNPENCLTFIEKMLAY